MPIDALKNTSKPSCNATAPIKPNATGNILTTRLSKIPKPASPLSKSASRFKIRSEIQIQSFKNIAENKRKHHEQKTDSARHQKDKKNCRHLFYVSKKNSDKL